MKTRTFELLWYKLNPFSFRKSKTLSNRHTSVAETLLCTAQNRKFCITDIFSKCKQMRSFLQVYSRLLKKYFNFIFCEVSVKLTQGSVTRACVEFSWNLLFCNIFPPWTAYDLIVNMTFRICIAFANLAFQFANKLVR